MSEQLYSIKEQTLTDIGDALRRKHGETEWIDVVTSETIADGMKVSKTPNATGFETSDGSHPAMSANNESIWDVVTISGASSIKVKMYAETDSCSDYCTFVFEGEVTELPEGISWTNGYGGTGKYSGYKEFSFDGDTVTFCFHRFNVLFFIDGFGYYAEITGYDADGNELVEGEIIIKTTPTEIKRTYNSSEMAQAIDDIEVGEILPEEAFNISGNCMYRFAYGGWDWFIEDYGARVTTKDVGSAGNMFDDSKVESIPFDINFAVSTSSRTIDNMFRDCINLKSIPKINNCVVSSSSYLFNGCRSLRELPSDIETWFDWSYIESLTSGYSGTQSNMFNGCWSLRSVPAGFLNHGNPVANYNYSYFSNAFNSCYVLDELVNMPIPYTATWTSNAFSNFVTSYRLKTLTFAMPDGVPYVMKRKRQTIDLSKYNGYMTDTFANREKILNYNSGITADKEVKDDATYQALKNDPDWFATKAEYSRYNHDSAVATINSLPDTSAYLATAGGTNTIKFTGAAGSATDGGAINTLTEEEIAVATAKGWTVTLS